MKTVLAPVDRAVVAVRDPECWDTRGAMRDSLSGGVTKSIAMGWVGEDVLGEGEGVRDVEVTGSREEESAIGDVGVLNPVKVIEGMGEGRAVCGWSGVEETDG